MSKLSLTAKTLQAAPGHAKIKAAQAENEAIVLKMVENANHSGKAFVSHVLGNAFYNALHRLEQKKSVRYVRGVQGQGAGYVVNGKGFCFMKSLGVVC